MPFKPHFSISVATKRYILAILRELLKGSDHSKTTHFAASLSFHTLLSIIPVLLISLFVFSSLPQFSAHIDELKAFIYANLLIENAAAHYLDSFLANSAGLTAIGLFALAITGALFFSEYEFAISQLTGSPKRPFWRALAHYWTLITLMPLGLILSFWMVNILQTNIAPSAAGAIKTIIPQLTIWAIFAVMYAVSINGYISSVATLSSSFIAALIWSFGRWAFIKYSFYNATYATIYGSFSILLFFFLWVYISWIIFLYGLKLCTILSSKKNDAI